jgi:hypothetical protein
MPAVTLKKAPETVRVTVSGYPRMNRLVKNPVAIATRYTNHHDLSRSSVETSFEVVMVDDHTPENLLFSDRHLHTGHCAVAIYSWSDANKFVEFQEEMNKECPGVTWLIN